MKRRSRVSRSARVSEFGDFGDLAAEDAIAIGTVAGMNLHLRPDTEPRQAPPWHMARDSQRAVVIGDLHDDLPLADRRAVGDVDAVIEPGPRVVGVDDDAVGRSTDFAVFRLSLEPLCRQVFYIPRGLVGDLAGPLILHVSTQRAASTVWLGAAVAAVYSLRAVSACSRVAVAALRNTSAACTRSF